jgi:hypothetical protein
MDAEPSIATCAMPSQLYSHNVPVARRWSEAVCRSTAHAIMASHAIDWLVTAIQSGWAHRHDVSLPSEGPQIKAASVAFAGSRPGECMKTAGSYHSNMSRVEHQCDAASPSLIV